MEGIREDNDMIDPVNVAEILPISVWNQCLRLLPLKDRMTCRRVCLGFKNQVDSILKKQRKLWIRNRDNPSMANCFQEDHRISDQDCLSYNNVSPPSQQDLETLHHLMPLIQVFKFDPYVVVQASLWNPCRTDNPKAYELMYQMQERDPPANLTDLFKDVECLVLPGKVCGDNINPTNKDDKLVHFKHLFVGVLMPDVSRFKPIPNLESLQVMDGYHGWDSIPHPSKRLVMKYPVGNSMHWKDIPISMEEFQAQVNYKKYETKNQPFIPNLKVLGPIRLEDRCFTEISAFLSDHKETLKEVSLVMTTKSNKIILNERDLLFQRQSRTTTSLVCGDFIWKL